MSPPRVLECGAIHTRSQRASTHPPTGQDSPEPRVLVGRCALVASSPGRLRPPLHADSHDGPFTARPCRCRKSARSRPGALWPMGGHVHMSRRPNIQRWRQWRFLWKPGMCQRRERAMPAMGRLVVVQKGGLLPECTPSDLARHDNGHRIADASESARAKWGWHDCCCWLLRQHPWLRQGCGDRRSYRHCTGQCCTHSRL
jgi:hypothetical protein